LKFADPQMVWLTPQFVSSGMIFLVKPFGKIIFATAFLVAIFAAGVKAQPPSQTNAAGSTAVSSPENSTGAAPTAEPSKAEALPSEAPPALLYIGPSPDPEVPSIFAGWWPKQIALPYQLVKDRRDSGNEESGVQQVPGTLLDVAGCSQRNAGLFCNIGYDRQGIATSLSQPCFNAAAPGCRISRARHVLNAIAVTATSAPAITSTR